MEKMSNTVLPLFLLVLIMMTTFPFKSVSASSHCKPMINDVLLQCQSYFMDHNSTSSSCCSATQSLVATCICDIQMEIQNLPPSVNVTEMFNLPTLCGVSLPCHLNNVSVAPSPADVPAESLPSQSNSSSSKPQPRSSPNSPMSDDHSFDFWIFLLILAILLLICGQASE